MIFKGLLAKTKNFNDRKERNSRSNDKFSFFLVDDPQFLG